MICWVWQAGQKQGQGQTLRCAVVDVLAQMDLHMFIVYRTVESSRLKLKAQFW